MLSTHVRRELLAYGRPVNTAVRARNSVPFRVASKRTVVPTWLERITCVQLKAGCDADRGPAGLDESSSPMSHLRFENGRAGEALRLLEFVDHFLADGDEDDTNAVRVSFMENCGYGQDEPESFPPLWPNGLRTELG